MSFWTILPFLNGSCPLCCHDVSKLSWFPTSRKAVFWNNLEQKTVMMILIFTHSAAHQMVPNLHKQTQSSMTRLNLSNAMRKKYHGISKYLVVKLSPGGSLGSEQAQARCFSIPTTSDCKKVQINLITAGRVWESSPNFEYVHHSICIHRMTKYHSYVLQNKLG